MNSNRGATRGRYDGTVRVVQPLIAPLYGGKSELDFVAVLNGQSSKPSHDIVHDYWQAQRPNVAQIRCVLGEDAAGRSCRGHGVSRQSKFLSSLESARRLPPPLRKGSKLFFARTPRSGMAALQTTAGCRNCPSR